MGTFKFPIRKEKKSSRDSHAKNYSDISRKGKARLSPLLIAEYY